MVYGGLLAKREFMPGRKCELWTSSWLYRTRFVLLKQQYSAEERDEISPGSLCLPALH